MYDIDHSLQIDWVNLSLKSNKSFLKNFNSFGKLHRFLSVKIIRLL